MTAAARILVVDDDDDSRSICEEILSVAGHRVITAADGEEAIAYALRVPFDLIVLDLCLPKVDGIGVIKELRSSRAAQATPIITVSAADELMHSEALAAGADLALRKPCLPQELHAAVRAFLETAGIGKKSRSKGVRVTAEQLVPFHLGVLVQTRSSCTRWRRRAPTTWTASALWWRWCRRVCGSQTDRGTGSPMGHRQRRGK